MREREGESERGKERKRERERRVSEKRELARIFANAALTRRRLQESHENASW